jgi:ABC-type transporter Mla subunit MlaD
MDEFEFPKMPNADWSKDMLLDHIDELEQQLAEWHTAFGHLSKDADQAACIVNEARDELEQQIKESNVLELMEEVRYEQDRNIRNTLQYCDRIKELERIYDEQKTEFTAGMEFQSDRIAELEQQIEYVEQSYFRLADKYNKRLDDYDKAADKILEYQQQNARLVESLEKIADWNNTTAAEFAAAALKEA